MCQDPDHSSCGRRTADRRTLLRQVAAASAVGWTAPLIIDGLTNPVAAVTCARASNRRVVFTGANMTPQPSGTPASGCGTCTGLTSNATAAAVGLSVSGGPINHGCATCPGNVNPVTITTGGCQRCRITAVSAVLHNVDPNNNGNTCNNPGAPNQCYAASAAGPLLIIGGALNTGTVTVKPDQSGLPNCQWHWGLLSTSPNCGLLVVTVTCV